MALDSKIRIFQGRGFLAQKIMKKIAFCFLVTQSHMQEELWKEYLSNYSNKYSLYAHCDKQNKVGWLESFRISERIPTSWNDHFNAWIALLRHAFSNPQNYKVVFVSEWCIPIRPFSELYKQLVRDDYSYFCSKPYKHRIFINNFRVLKNEEWCVLNREHAQHIVQDPDKILSGIRNCRLTKHPNEHVESTVICGAGYKNIHSYHLTYTWWKPKDNKHPFTFNSMNKIFVQHLMSALESGRFFMRKVHRNVDATVIKYMTKSDRNSGGIIYEDCIQRDWMRIREQWRDTKCFSNGNGAG